MRDRLEHRGPDAIGEKAGEGFAFGFRRLAIIDLSPAGNQPLANEDETVWLMFNGELYNYKALREELLARGHAFRSQADSEIVVHAYEEYGFECIEKLHGMYAFALWDIKQKQLVLVRDRFGKKPLLYAEQNSDLFFASEMSALSPALRTKTVDHDALAEYFRFQAIPSPKTVYREVRKLPPASYAVWKDGRISVTQYWSLRVEKPHEVTEQDAGREVERLLRSAVKKRLMSDVPLGVFLSGGLDSSILTALVADIAGSVKTFSIGFGTKTHDELSLARLVAQRYRTEHHEFSVRPNAIEDLPKILGYLGEPFADSSVLATYAVAKATRQHVTVALTGDGGDENFAGYDKYPLLLALARADRIAPKAVRHALGVLARSAATLFPRSTGRKLRVASRLARGGFEERFLDTLFQFGRDDVSMLLPEVRSSACLDDEAARRIADLPTDSTDIQRLSMLDLRLYLPECLMVKADIASMSASLEARAPFLDHELVQYTINLPDRLKIGSEGKKTLLKRQFGHLVPKELLHAPKRGFDLPVNEWLRNDLKTYLTERLTDRTFRSLPYFNFTYIDRLLAEHESKRMHHGLRLWSLLCFVTWYEQAQR